MQLERWCEDGSQLVTAAAADLSSSVSDLACFMETHRSLKLDEIWTSEATYVHVLTPSLQVSNHQYSAAFTNDDDKKKKILDRQLRSVARELIPFHKPLSRRGLTQLS